MLSGMWTILSEERVRKGTSYYAEARCECGRIALVRYLGKGRLRSDSCPACAAERKVKHGLADTPIYKVWQEMRNRCQNPNAQSYENYGGRGIKVCKRWEDFASFYADMGDRPKGLTLERKNNDGDYKPSNCIWATRRVQNRNSRNVRKVTANGEMKLLVDWAKELDLDPQVIYSRLHRGWSEKEAVTTRADDPYAMRSERNGAAQLTFEGETMTISQWAKRKGIKRTTIQERVRMGWPVEKILGTKAQAYAQTLTVDGLKLTYQEWADRLGIPRITIAVRLSRGLSPRAALGLVERRT